MSPTSLSTERWTATSLPQPLDATVRLPVALGSRLANIVYTAQVQLAYGCADDARHSAERSIARLESSWLAAPVRDLLVEVYRSQADAAARMADQVLANARKRCGLAFAPVGCSVR
jgi:hypothetical protein